MPVPGPQSAEDQSSFPQDDLFSAPSYSAWVRGTMRIPTSEPKPAILFGSSISEPTAELVNLVRQAFSDPLTSRYISVFSDGNRFVTDAICSRYGARTDHVLTTTGVRSALSLIVKGLTRPGDHMLIEEPTFDLLAAIMTEAGVRIGTINRTAPDFKFDLDQVADRLLPDTRLVLITNLHNPSGAYLTPDEIRDLARILAARDIVLVVDEIYLDFARPTYQGTAAALAPNIVSANSLAKVFGLDALKCGWTIAHPDLLTRIQNEALDPERGVSKLSHAVAAHVLESAELFDQRWQAILHTNRTVLEEHVSAMMQDGLIAGEIPEFGCMYFPKVCGTTDTMGLARKLWRGFGILVAPGEFFGLAGHIRIGFGEDKAELDRGLARLRTALKDLHGR